MIKTQVSPSYLSVIESKLRNCNGIFKTQVDKCVVNTFIKLQALNCNTEEQDTIDKICLNSLFFLNKLDWEGEGTPLMRVLGDFVKEAMMHSNTQKIMLQSWRIFAVALYAMAQGQLVQATSLFDTCQKIAMFNFVTSGNVSNCYSGISLLLNQKNDNKMYNTISNKNLTGQYIAKDLNDLQGFLKQGCNDCAKLDNKDTLNISNDSDAGCFPCYEVLEDISDKKGLVYKFFSCVFPEIVVSHNFKSFLRKKHAKQYPRKIDFAFWSVNLNNGKWINKDYRLMQGKINKGFLLHQALMNTSCLFKDFTEAISVLRNALAHGNLKQQCSKDSKYYSSQVEIIDACAMMICDMYCFLKNLTEKMYEDINGERLIGMDLFLHYILSPDNNTPVDNLNNLRNKPAGKNPTIQIPTGPGVVKWNGTKGEGLPIIS